MASTKWPSDQQESNARHAGLNPVRLEPNLCSTCTQMTSTLDGLEGLTSKTGFAHHDRHQLAAFSKEGCFLCFWSFSQLCPYWPFDSPGRLHFFADYRAVRFWSMSGSVQLLEDESESSPTGFAKAWNFRALRTEVRGAIADRPEVLFLHTRG